MKTILWILLGLAVSGPALYVVTGPWIPKNQVTEFLIFVLFTVPSVGAFWMLYVGIRNERHPWPIVLLAFVPYAFLWYYFERVRAGKHRTRAVTTV
jgi:hypothetical protein